jgi:hypothetical protein
MADTSQTPLADIIGEGRDAGPGAKPEAQPPPPSVSEQAGIAPPPPEREETPGIWAYAALKDERAKRQAFQQQVRELQEERDALLQAQVRQQQQPQQQRPSAEDDFWASPEGFIERRMRNQEANFSFRLAHDKYGDDFERAYSGMVALAERGDPSVIRWVMSTPDPGQAMMNWYANAIQQWSRHAVEPHRRPQRRLTSRAGMVRADRSGHDLRDEKQAMNTAQIDRMVRAAVLRAGYSEDVVPRLRDMVAFHILMSNENINPERVGIVIDELLPGMAVVPLSKHWHGPSLSAYEWT